MNQLEYFNIDGELCALQIEETDGEISSAAVFRIEDVRSREIPESPEVIPWPTKERTFKKPERSSNWWVVMTLLACGLVAAEWMTKGM